MKILLITLFLSLPFTLFSQDKFVGSYRNHFFSRIELNTNHTFSYTWRFENTSSWTKGTWSLDNDTVYFHVIPTYDTVSYRNSNGTSADKLILSGDEIPRRFTTEQYVSQGLSSRGQNIQPFPEKLFFKNQRLIAIRDGKLLKKKMRGWTEKKWRPWFFKSDD